MNQPSRDALILRRGQLLQRSTQLRADWSRQVRGLRSPLGLADQVRDGVDWLVRNPEWPLGAVVLVLVLRPRRAIGWASTLWWGWGMLRRAQRLMGRLDSRR